MQIELITFSQIVLVAFYFRFITLYSVLIILVLGLPACQLQMMYGPKPKLQLLSGKTHPSTEQVIHLASDKKLSKSSIIKLEDTHKRITVLCLGAVIKYCLDC